MGYRATSPVYYEPSPYSASYMEGNLTIFRELPQNLVYERFHGLFSHFLAQFVPVDCNNEFFYRRTGDPPCSAILPFHFSQSLQTLLLATCLRGKLPANFGSYIGDHIAMGRISYFATLCFQLPESLHVEAQVLHRACTMAEHIVACEHGILFLKDETHVIMRVAFSMDSSYCGTFNAELLSVRDRSLSLVGAVLVHAVGEVWIHAKEIGHSTSVITVPMSKHDTRQANRRLVELAFDQVCPFAKSLRGINYEPLFAGPDDVGIGALECELCNGLSCQLHSDGVLLTK